MRWCRWWDCFAACRGGEIGDKTQNSYLRERKDPRELHQNWFEKNSSAKCLQDSCHDKSAGMLSSDRLGTARTLQKLTHQEPIARLVAETAAVGVVRTAERCLGDGALARPVVAVHRVPNDLAVNGDVAIRFFREASKNGGVWQINGCWNVRSKWLTTIAVNKCISTFMTHYCFSPFLGC